MNPFRKAQPWDHQAKGGQNLVKFFEILSERAHVGHIVELTV